MLFPADSITVHSSKSFSAKGDRSSTV